MLHVIYNTYCCKLGRSCNDLRDTVHAYRALRCGVHNISGGFENSLKSTAVYWKYYYPIARKIQNYPHVESNKFRLNELSSVVYIEFDVVHPSNAHQS